MDAPNKQRKRELFLKTQEGSIPARTGPSTSVKHASNHRRGRNNPLIPSSTSTALTQLSFVRLRSPTAPLFCIRARFVRGGERRSGADSKHSKHFLHFLKYQTVGGVIWLGDPALAAGGAEWRGLTSCLPGWLQAEESREREREGERRRAAKDEGERERRTRAREHTRAAPNWHEPAAILSSPHHQICPGHLLFYTSKQQ